MGEALRLIKENHGVELDLDAIPLDDKASCEILCKGETAGVFQLESEGITKLVMDLKPEHFEDLIPLVALYRPGPLGSGMVEDFIKRRHKEKEVTYLHPILEPILEDTFGVILYQEQVMQIASAMGGFSLGQADLMRRAMGKKKESVLKAQRDSFVTGSVNNGIDEKLANEVFDLLLYFAGYGFNKSHSAAYAYIAYQTAYLKAHYFPEFMAATMTSFMGNMDKMTNYINICKAKQVAVLGPDINHSERMFTVQEGQIRFGLGGIKNVGDNAIEELLVERKANGQFTSIVDFYERIPYRVVNKRLLESLIRCGAMDSFKENRNQLLQIYEQAQGIGSKGQKSSAIGAVSLFADVEEMETIHVPDLPDLPKDLKLKDEKEYTGFYITGHPLDAYRQELADLFQAGRLSENPESFDRKVVTVGGLITDKVDRITKNRQEKMCTLTVEDFTGTVQVVVFPQAYQKAHMLLQRDAVVAIEGRIDADEKGVQLIATSVQPLKVEYEKVRQIRVHIDRAHDTPQVSQQLQRLLQELPGDTPVSLFLETQKRTLAVNRSFYFTPSKESIGRVQVLLGANAVELL